jgi:hypothetical protein|tara:strand:+ start:1547 stop:2074 length:528 start_codon:yes stop_codon:yes gene_type:complete
VTDWNALAQSIHQANVDAGWWDEWPNRKDRYNTARMLIVTELAEGAEGARKDLMDDHLPHRKMLDVELADAAIRILDLAGACEINLNFKDAARNGNGAGYWSQFWDRMRNDLERLDIVARSVYVKGMDVALFRIITLCKYKRIPLLEIIEEKRAYNAQRADHKRENRAQAGGKKW